jgi:YesN/AraC family two-component response regulator
MIATQRLAGCVELTMMLRLHELQKSTSRDRAEPVEIWKARRFIEQRSGEELSLHKVAKAVNISPSYLSEKFKQVTGAVLVH